MPESKHNMNTPAMMAKHLRDLHFGGNWTSVNLKDTVADITWQQATTPVYSLNTIATLVFHINYYIAAVLKVLQGQALNASDSLSFNHPPIHAQEDWEKFLDKVWTDAGDFATLVEQLPESMLWENLADEKYGTYFRNIQGIIEHSHYHLGQVVIIKKILLQQEKT